MLLLMIAAGTALRCREAGILGIPVFLAGALPVMGFLYPFFRVGALGAGDVKLFGVTAGFLPFKKILLFSFFSLLIAAAFSIFKLLKKRCVGERLYRLMIYLKNIVCSGTVDVYPGAIGGEEAMTVCLAGPVLLSVLLLWGGVY